MSAAEGCLRRKKFTRVSKPVAQHDINLIFDDADRHNEPNMDFCTKEVDFNEDMVNRLTASSPHRCLPALAYNHNDP